MITIVPPHLGQRQKGLACPAGDAADSICGCGMGPSNLKQRGSRVARRRLARKPNGRMRTKPRGSRCSRKRRRNSSSDREQLPDGGQER
jgi:hypothetical protein